MINSFNITNWRHKYITMSEIVSEPQEVDSGYYDRNKDVILKSIESEGFSQEDAEDIFELMKDEGLTQADAIPRYLDQKDVLAYDREKGEDYEDNGEFSDDLEYNEINEDLDLGHEDDEPHMIKSELYQIGKYAMDLYKMMSDVEGKGEVDLPAWWQSKITTAKNMISGAKHYLEFEANEPAIDTSVNITSEEDNETCEGDNKSTDMFSLYERYSNK